MSNLENLKPWPKGVSGNPAGRPPEPESWAAIVKRIGQESSPKEPKKTRKEKATEAAYEQAERGNYKAWAALASREDGAPEQPVKHSGEVKTGAALPMTPEIAKLAEEYEQRILEELKKTNA